MEQVIAGRPRDSRIDADVIAATRELLVELGYLRLTIAAIAERAGTTKPAIYRRWPTKAHLVHETVFPVQVTAGDLLAGDLRSDVGALVANALEVLATPAARAAIPGLLAEMMADPDLHADVLSRFADSSWLLLQERLDAGVLAGEVRQGMQAATLIEVIAGATVVATLTRPDQVDDQAWREGLVSFIVAGLAAPATPPRKKKGIRHR